MYFNMIKGYFIETKLKYFKDGSFNYNKFPKDIRSNSILERYNKIIKSFLGEKITCNWVVFCNFIYNEINRINNQLAKNENINVLFHSKNTGFGKEKFLNEKTNFENNNIIINNIESKHENILNIWLKQKGNNCRYNAFITLLYFTITSFIKEKKKLAVQHY